MKIRGTRECKDCGHQWSYYDTASVACPNCESLRSVGIDERTRHTDGAVDLDLSAHRTALDDADIGDVADDLKSTLRAYIRQRGFIHGGDLRPLDETFLAAHELLQAVDVYTRTRDPTDDEELYVLALVRGADTGARPDPDDVPASMRAARGLAYANAVADYRRDLTTWLDDNPDPEGRTTLGVLVDHVKRAESLQGDVSLGTSEGIVRVAQDLGTYLAEGDETALATARDRLSRLA